MAKKIKLLIFGKSIFKKKSRMALKNRTRFLLKSVLMARRLLASAVFFKAMRLFVLTYLAYSIVLVSRMTETLISPG